MLLIKKSNQYIAEKDGNYYLTKYIEKAKNFNWVHFWFGGKVVLDGIIYKFGEGFEYIKVNRKDIKRKEKG